MGPGSYGDSIFLKSIALFYDSLIIYSVTLNYACQSIGVNPFRVSGVVLGFALLLVVKLVKNSHTRPTTDPLFVFTFLQTRVPSFLHGQPSKQVHSLLGVFSLELLIIFLGFAFVER